jgi:hypothetical protein
MIEIRIQAGPENSYTSGGLYSTCIDRLNSNLISERRVQKALRWDRKESRVPSSGATPPSAAELRRSPALGFILGYERS